MEKFDVSVVACPDYENTAVRAALEQAVSAAGGLDWVRSGMKIGVKANLVARMKPEKAKQKYGAEPGDAAWESRKLTIMDEIVSRGELDNVLLAAGQYNQKAEYVYSRTNLMSSWLYLLLFVFFFAVLSGLILQFVDKDKR